MTEQEYLSVLRQIRAWIVRGDAADLRRAEEALEPLRSIYPKRLSYVAAETALMLAKGEAAEDCRKVIDYAVQEVHPQEGLADLFALKGQTYAEGTPERRQLDFLVEFYTSGVLPQKPFAVLDAMKGQLRTGGVDADGLRDLAEQYYVTRNVLFSLVLMMAWCRLSGHMGDYENYVLWDAGQPNYKPGVGMNYGFLARMLADGNSYTFLLLAGENDDDIPVLAMALRLLGHEPILLRECGAVHAAENVHAYAQRCVQEAEVTGEHITLTVGKYKTGAGTVEDAMPAVLRLLTHSITQAAPLIVFASDQRMGELHERIALAGEIQRLSSCLPPPFSYALSFAWTGSYLKYVSYLYGESVEELLATPPSCDFSIVIPVRNSAKTLRHTLATCLAMEYAGSYEIVLSDNSNEGCTEVCELCEELSDPRIRYYKTPLSLSLDKSFEYAFLHARGEFIFSVGADDGVCPWALTYLAKALTEHPNEEIFSWSRGFYTWPDFTPYKDGIVGIELYDAEQEQGYVRYGLASNIEYVVQHIEQVFYSLPLLYINSGFRRSYLTRVLQQTGRLLDGAAQDSYMGAVNLLLNDHVIHLLCPLTIAGMSGTSTGANVVISKGSILTDARASVKQPRLHRFYGEYVMRDREWRVPLLDVTDKAGFHVSVVRLSDMNVTDLEADEEMLFSYCARQIALTDSAFERFWGLVLHAASLRNEKLYRMYLKRYEELCAVPEYVEHPLHEFVTMNKRGYAAQNNTLTLDAEDFGCRNVADAVGVTMRILNL